MPPDDPPKNDDPLKDPPKADPPKNDPDDEPLGESGKRALERERAARKEAEAKVKELEPLAAKAKELEDANKSDIDKANEKVAVAEKRAQDAELNAWRLEVATEKGLNASQAKRLVGTTKDELLADADASIEDGTFVVNKGGAMPPPSKRPKPDLRTGSDPDGDDEPEAKDLIDAIPRI